ncbi:MULTISPECIES: bifunctional diaminohydroxyphosphoribosylaminopyrimidine deaminase/5-amino-6-(5-phosphoribosylamino)uracil reductase RibD [unclassified Rubrivivax]|uniref:bifunctional diaminohydroxyphosphoribosylaminopyrimidine deaminase/5-amino-6-(5-phosphoribosylamino)uracil reductase RibD n=1 Tax=unclassified Rubrivivax TaxID=2649762 RepID=UPI001E3F6E48|nr:MULTISPECIES: bifunctional diaminohydroxyphosphoribosylaminopyrimidine deaminase/5-amino-6-(5-phosphoribosylamino)uracil reductase RibD [unclassified Rubrivivax]MCC9595345.1 bifunctional diaminohydroxyphosphoribosylaminopyrimidine deaminase/5-amino-6-(5-phosphoribosylamino)uracil reductase RibD [Rubrivivax sp. JA1055]MCC9647148.1 bifunctional diaminohydroxyphosphoribosylaminopyrimidine deaminase/5-amino-6-(5-phosphoribosylamino)uracil reductase RibD [Rubrivivax sp. JA1029]
MPLAPLDRTRLLEALALAEGSIGLTDPNPRVGCVIGHDDGRVLGRGATQRAGQAHAEVMALRDAAAAGHDTRGATAWVTLEPCAHHGRTPPCCDALVAAGIARVVVAVGDPFPQVAGAGITRLRAAGVQVELGDEDLAAAARELNIGFFSRVERGRPWLRMKIAASLDGRTALPNGASQWITGEAARTDGHAWRRRAGCVLTGIGTVLDDDPRLDVRRVPTVLQPMRAVMDSGLRLPAGARVLAPPGRCLVFHAAPDSPAVAVLAAAGAELHARPGTDGRVDAPAVLADLAALGVNELHVEAGARLNGALLAAGLVDELLVYTAPLLLGEGRPMAALGPFETLAQGHRYGFVDATPVGEDLRLRLRRAAM